MTKALLFSSFNNFIRFEMIELFMKKLLQTITNVNYEEEFQLNKHSHVKNSMIA